MKRAAPQLRSAPFNYAKGTTYALKYALTPNSSYEVFSNGDCTNFTSQIAFAGGKKKVWAANPSGYPWYWDKKGVYSRSWTVAFTFAQYWTADGAITLNYNDKASAQKGYGLKEHLLHIGKKILLI
ncbi:amidase domain-containing protein [Vagococcus xieshaowenii]|uniref:Putative amidase domain-containing protein n=1 Tax=Vagococcus xieshaowenii TaxID=2562451 RepID=A0ABX5TH16_9ENTE|nr:amidase domain-containing protein [Vagococcus xieshaowenii]QCA29656.1 hypothetical protein E4Z98_09720 [Vagococcus xieshaowenii]